MALFWPCVSFHCLFEAISAFLFFLKFRFPKRATKIWWNLPVDLNFTKVDAKSIGRFRQICVDFLENLNCKKGPDDQTKTHFFGDKIAFFFRVHKFFRFVFIPRNLRSTRGTLKCAPYKLEKLPHSEYNLKNHSRPFT